MLATMAKKQQKPFVEYHRHPRIAFHLPESQRKALAAYRESLRPRPSESEIVRTALEMFLKEKGFWPPRDE